MANPMPPSELAVIVDRLLPHPQGTDSLERDVAVFAALSLTLDLMAENQRMRRELEALRDEFRFIHHRRRAHEHITRILEGDTQ